jgi:hypothetical protein
VVVELPRHRDGHAENAHHKPEREQLKWFELETPPPDDEKRILLRVEGATFVEVTERPFEVGGGGLAQVAVR